MTEKKKTKKEIEQELLKRMEQDSGHGMEGADNDCFAVSYLTVLQDMSPQVKKKNEEYIQGAEPGMLFDTASGEVFDGDEGVEIVQIGFERRVNIWKPNRGGFAGMMSVNDERFTAGKHGEPGSRDEFKTFDEAGNELVDTRNHFVYILKADGTFSPAVMSCSASKIKISNKFMSKLRGIMLDRSDGSGKYNPPTFAFAYRLRTFLDSNNSGDEFYNFRVPEMSKQVVDPEIYEQSRNMNLQIAEGKVQAALPPAPSEDNNNGDM